MPVVRAYFGTAKNTSPGSISELRVVCGEVVPAALHVPKAPLFPGSIYFIDGGEQNIPVDVFLDIEAKPNKQRDSDEASRQIRHALHKLQPGLTFAICVKLCQNAWLSDRPQPHPPDVDMSIRAATERAHLLLAEIRDPDRPVCLSCGNVMVRAGATFVCPSCGTTSDF